MKYRITRVFEVETSDGPEAALTLCCPLNQVSSNTVTIPASSAPKAPAPTPGRVALAPAPAPVSSAPAATPEPAKPEGYTGKGSPPEEK